MSRPTAAVVLALLAVAATCLALAPLVLPDSYEVLRQPVSRAGAQGVPGAWLARTGYVLLGLAVLVEAARAGEAWGPVGRAAHAVYATAMVCLAVFSASPWYGGPGDTVEASLHTWAATVAVGAFFVGVLGVRIQRGRRPGRIAVLDVVALAGAPVLALAAETMPGGAGVTERLIFVIGFTWYGVEAVRLSHPDAPGRVREI
ncbi:DUF998 domain-containing protein [Isoptericola sp. AK164]|uniref:DUF998 domain-containing protein n=1 Tax=Isoptericola sp. AK164 TaxID=3024246 RepID=UPI0024187130|nr:DUF998 domain-containing protein [Isoptericola sp. AK164]